MDGAASARQRASFRRGPRLPSHYPPGPERIGHNGGVWHRPASVSPAGFWIRSGRGTIHRGSKRTSFRATARRAELVLTVLYSYEVLHM